MLAVEPSTVARGRAADRVAAAPQAVEFVGLDGESIPLEDDSADAALCTFTLCTIPDVDRALAEIRRVVRPGGEFRFATDIDDYAGWTLARLLPRKDLVWLAETAADWQQPWPEWHRTRYEEKAVREGRVPGYFRFRKEG